ncbi:exodeoxyribonuclease III [Candidatus Saccharibacteria bacterium]|nr:exodeoxyribonuclease III [Candidatus Saccharibacteria bacterium]
MKTTYRIFSWNVNGIRAVLKKQALQNLIAEKNPDILCLQEVKANPDQIPSDDYRIIEDNYLMFWNAAKRPGYSGTAILTRDNGSIDFPLGSWIGLEEDLEISQNWEEDKYGTPLEEGRVLTVEYQDFFLVTVYTPNSKPDLSRLKLRETLWDPSFLEYMKILDEIKPVVFCGDLNAAHTEIDLARPKQNEHNAGYTKEERQGIENLEKAGFIDTFRELHPDEKRYTWWSHWGHARKNNVGWRIDYFFISKRLRKNLKSAEIYEDITGSDHCPISITLEF